jgi:two-component system nitrate/nitrite response regulator NarL
MRIFLCDDSRSFIAVVGFWLEEADDLDLVGSAENRAAALEALPTLKPDVVLLDTMAVGDDDLGVDEVRAASGGARVVVYSGHEPEAARQFVSGEADLYLRKGDEQEHLIEALRGLAG